MKVYSKQEANCKAYHWKIREIPAESKIPNSERDFVEERPSEPFLRHSFFVFFSFVLVCALHPYLSQIGDGCTS